MKFRKTVSLLLYFSLLLPSKVALPNPPAASQLGAGGGNTKNSNGQSSNNSRRESCKPNSNNSDTDPQSKSDAPTSNRSTGTSRQNQGTNYQSQEGQGEQNQGQQRNDCLEWTARITNESVKEDNKGNELFGFVESLFPRGTYRPIIDTAIVQVRQTSIGEKDPAYPFFYFTSITFLANGEKVAQFEFDTQWKSLEQALLLSVLGKLKVDNDSLAVTAENAGEVLLRASKVQASSILFSSIDTYAKQTLFKGNKCVCNSLVDAVNALAVEVKTRRKRYWLAYVGCIGAIVLGYFSVVGSLAAGGIALGCITAVGGQAISLLLAERRYETKKRAYVACVSCCLGSPCTTEICEHYLTSGPVRTHFCPLDRCEGQDALPIGTSNYNKAIFMCDKNLSDYSTPF